MISKILTKQSLTFTEWLNRIRCNKLIREAVIEGYQLYINSKINESKITQRNN